MQPNPATEKIERILAEKWDLAPVSPETDKLFQRISEDISEEQELLKQIVEEMWGRRVSNEEFQRQLELFKHSCMSGKAFREMMVDRLSTPRYACCPRCWYIRPRSSSNPANWFGVTCASGRSVAT